MCEDDERIMMEIFRINIKRFVGKLRLKNEEYSMREDNEQRIPMCRIKQREKLRK